MKNNIPYYRGKCVPIDFILFAIFTRSFMPLLLAATVMYYVTTYVTHTIRHLISVNLQNTFEQIQ